MVAGGHTGSGGQPAMRDFYLCHGRPDKDEHILPLAEELERRGVTYWLDKLEMQPGDSEIGRMNQGIRNSRFMVAALSERFIGRYWAEKEFGAGQREEARRKSLYVIRLILSGEEQVDEAYPLMADSHPLRWSDGLGAVVDQLEGVLGRREPGTARLPQPPEQRAPDMPRDIELPPELAPGPQVELLPADSFYYVREAGGICLRAVARLRNPTPEPLRMDRVEVEALHPDGTATPLGIIGGGPPRGRLQNGARYGLNPRTLQTVGRITTARAPVGVAGRELADVGILAVGKDVAGPVPGPLVVVVRFRDLDGHEYQTSPTPVRYLESSL